MDLFFTVSFTLFPIQTEGGLDSIKENQSMSVYLTEPKTIKTEIRSRNGVATTNFFPSSRCPVLSRWKPYPDERGTIIKTLTITVTPDV